MHGGGPPECARSDLGEPDRARLAGVHQLGHRADAVLDRHPRIGAVQLVEVDVVHPETAQARVARGADVLRAAVHPAQRLVLRVAHDAALGREDDLRAPPPDGLPHQLLVREWPVHVGGVEQRDAQVERAVDGGDRLRFVRRPVELAHAHAPEAEGGDLERAELACFHAHAPITFTTTRFFRRPSNSM